MTSGVNRGWPKIARCSHPSNMVGSILHPSRMKRALKIQPPPPQSLLLSCSPVPFSPLLYHAPRLGRGDREHELEKSRVVDQTISQHNPQFPNRLRLSTNLRAFIGNTGLDTDPDVVNVRNVASSIARSTLTMQPSIEGLHDQRDPACSNRTRHVQHMDYNTWMRQAGGCNQGKRAIRILTSCSAHP